MTKTKVIGLVVAAAATYGVWHWHGSSGGDDQADGGGKSKLVFDRLWIDHMPRSETDTIQVFLALREEAMGVHQSASVWAGKYELFQFEYNKGEMRVVYPQTRERETVKVNADKCQVDGMDYCLEISGSSRGVRKYYSQKGWEVKGSEAQALAQAAEIEHALAQAAGPDASE
jgi:hypothetical protein